MYSTVLQNGKTAGWYFNELPGAGGPGEDYMSVSIPSYETEMAGALLERGFRAVERGIVMEMPVGRFRPAVSPGKKFGIAVQEDWRPETVFSVAKESFETDSRFAFGPAGENTALKNELLYGYLTELKREGKITATFLSQEGRLEGFNLWNIQEGAGRVLMGAVSGRYRNTGIALPLYSHTVEAMRERGANTLRDIVASSNMSSLNLHAMLIRCAGGVFRFGYCQDSYRKERASAGV